nr:MAG TPA: hypothetical protein [Caudoviricetes sp.]
MKDIIFLSICFLRKTFFFILQYISINFHTTTNFLYNKKYPTFLWSTF